jgi:RNA recognition motif-containing protein
LNIYVGNLNYSASNEDLEALFQGYGSVTSAKIIFDRERQRSKGFGFVEMPDDEEANQAIDSLNGSDFMGRPLKVNKARERKRGI